MICASVFMSNGRGYSETRVGVSRKHYTEVGATIGKGPRGQVFVRGVKRAATLQETDRDTGTMVSL